MKTKILALLTLTFLFGFSFNDLKDFYKGKDVQVRLEAGTRGEILERSQLENGNLGLKIRVLNSEKQDRIFWVNYRGASSDLSLLNRSGKEVQDVNLATQVLLIERNIATEDRVAEEVRSLIKKLPSINDIVLSKREDCPPVQTPAPVATPQPVVVVILTPTPTPIPTPMPTATPTPEPTPLVVPSEFVVDGLSNLDNQQYSEEILTAPFKQLNESELFGEMCGTRPGNKGWEYCYVENAEKKKIITGFKFRNDGPNEIVANPSKGYSINRSYEFRFRDQARADVQLYVVDAPNEFTSTATYNLYTFFPRKYLPAINRVKDELHVVLPNGEKVIYDALTKKIKSGVLSEKPMEELKARANCDVVNKPCGRKAKADPITYTGSGVVIKVSASGNLPVGDLEKGKKNPNIATVQKNGKTCQLPVADYWVTDYERGGVVGLNPKYSTDQAFDEVLKSKCGFSMFD